MPDAPAPDLDRMSSVRTRPQPARKPAHRRRNLLMLGAIPVVLVGLAAFGIVARQSHDAGLSTWTDAQAIPTVALVKPQILAGSTILKLPGNVQAYYEAPIYARVDGYLKAWYFDIGAHVKQGQVLAVIDTPDLDQQLNQAHARVAMAAADQRLAAITAARWRSLLATRSVAQQTVDEKEGEAEAKMAALQAAKADVSRLEALESFKTITAPFDGIVTARKTDIGALIQAGSSRSDNELFAVADVHAMRVYVPVPQAFVSELTPGTTATLSLPQYPGRTFPARLDTSSNAVNVSSRTALFELMAPNPEGKLWPGTYADVTFKIQHPADHLSVPAGALIFQAAGPQLAIVGPDDRVELRDVKIGLDTGSHVEIVSGLHPGDRVINNPPDSIVDGEKVRPASDAAPSRSPTRA